MLIFNVRCFEHRHVLVTSILHATIGVMNTSRRRLPCIQGDFKSRQTQLGINALGDRPANYLA
jgi:hypothetical protein